MKNKKGFLLAEETLKIVIALISIGLLVYLLISLYLSNKDEQNLELAKSSLEHLSKQINSKTSEVEVYNPDGWSLLSWPYEGKVPLSCSNLGWGNCLCICKTPLVRRNKNYLENCDGNGICSETKNLVVKKGDIQLPIEIDNPPLKLKINYGEEIIIFEK